MEPKRKLVAVEGQGVGAESIMIDRMSDLPNQVAHHILSFLDITHLTRFGCVSKRCRELWLTAPSLIFDTFSPGNKSTWNNRMRLFDGLDWFLRNRCDNKIQTFRVCWIINEEDDICDDEYFRVMSWVHNAVNCNVEQLYMCFSDPYEGDLEFPASIFLCGSLRYLTLHLHISWGLLESPSLAVSSNLKSLELMTCTVDENFFQWISCCCKCMEELILKQVGAEITSIESSSLKRVFVWVNFTTTNVLKVSGEKLETIEIDWRIDSPGTKSLDIVAPNLKSLKLTGNLVNHCKLGKLELLEEAYILLEPQVDDFDNIFGVFSCLCKVKELTLNEASLKALFREGSTAAPLHDVSYLVLEIGDFSDELVPAMVSLFRGMPNLCYLSIDTNPALDETKSNTSAFDVGYWKLQNLAFIHKLEQVSIELSLGSNGVQLLKYILEYAKNLDYVLIMYLPQNLEDHMTKLGKFKIISNVTVVFEKKKL